MKRIAFISSLFVLSLVFLLSGCGGGGGGTAAPAASKQVTTGVITGFGSVIVNGIEFQKRPDLADNVVKFKFEDNALHPEKDLRAGMIVTIRGNFDDTTKKGQFEAIEFQPELRGRMGEVVDIDLVNDKFKAMGVQVQIEPNNVFENIRDLAELQAEVQAGRHPELEISGTIDNATGVLHATRISRKTVDFQNNGLVEIKAVITAGTAGAASFTVNGITVSTAGATFVNMTINDIAPGISVEVKGILNTTTNTITSARIEKKAAIAIPGAQVNDNVRIKGTAAGGIVSNTFTLNGQNAAITVKTDANTLFLKGGVAATSAIVAAGASLQVEGALQADGSILATKVSMELEKVVKLEGNLAAAADIDTTAGTIKLNSVTVNVVAATKLLDGSTLAADLAAFKTALATGSQHLQIAGFVDATGKVIASTVQRTTASTLTFIQGPVSAKTATALTILGITVDTSSIAQAKDFIDNSTGTKLPGTGTVSQAQTAFFAKVVAGTTIVKAKGTITGTNMAASEVELEQAM